MENRIKEQFMLFADRVSAETMRANQRRLYLSAMAYVLVSGLRRLGLQTTELAHAQVSTIRLRLLKIGAHLRVIVRKVWLSLPRSYRWPDLFQRVYFALTGRSPPLTFDNLTRSQAVAESSCPYTTWSVPFLRSFVPALPPAFPHSCFSTGEKCGLIVDIKVADFVVDRACIPHAPLGIEEKLPH